MHDKPEEGIGHFREVMEESSITRWPSDIVASYLGLAECHIRLEQFRSALTFGCKALRATAKHIESYREEIEQAISLVVLAAQNLPSQTESVRTISDDLMSKIIAFDNTSTKMVAVRSDMLERIKSAMQSLARIVNRRTRDIFTSGDLTLDLISGDIILDGELQKSRLSASERKLIRYLKKHLNKSCDRRDLYAEYTGCNREELYIENTDSPKWNESHYDAVGRMIIRIRNKGISKQILQTVQGQGFKLVRS